MKKIEIKMSHKSYEETVLAIVWRGDINHTANPRRQDGPSLSFIYLELSLSIYW